MKPTHSELVIIIKTMRRYLEELTAVADASGPDGRGVALADAVRMYVSAAIGVSRDAV